jgi:thiamine-phosphate pyrophosphorylase
MEKKTISGIYLVTDTQLAGNRELADVVAQAVAGGVSVVQYREKHLSDEAFAAQARKLLAVLRPLGIPLLFNDRVELARQLGADGVHIGQEDMPYHQARVLLGPAAIIGLSIQDWQSFDGTYPEGLDYLAPGPIFDTATKTNYHYAWGLEALAHFRQKVTLPLVAIGGIHAGNARQVLEAGANAVAVVSAICAAPNPELAARELVSCIP